MIVDKQRVEVSISLNIKIVRGAVSKEEAIAMMLERIDGMTITSIDEGDWELTLSSPALLGDSRDHQHNQVHQVQIGGKNNTMNIS